MWLEWKDCGSVDHEVIWGLLGLTVILVAAVVPVADIMSAMGYRCGFLSTTGIPCPSCGATRAFVAAGTLQFATAFRFNPLAAALFVGLCLYVPWALGSVILKRKRLRITSLSRRDRWLIIIVALVLVLSNWAYLVATHRS